MKSLNEIKYITQLIDIYGSLLSACKFKYIESYYFKNFTLREIADKFNISHAAVYDSIKEGIKELKDFENKLKFIDKQKVRLDFYKKNIKDKQTLEQLIELELEGKISC